MKFQKNDKIYCHLKKTGTTQRLVVLPLLHYDRLWCSFGCTPSSCTKVFLMNFDLSHIGFGAQKRKYFQRNPFLFCSLWLPPHRMLMWTSSRAFNIQMLMERSETSKPIGNRLTKGQKFAFGHLSFRFYSWPNSYCRSRSYFSCTKCTDKIMERKIRCIKIYINFHHE